MASMLSDAHRKANDKQCKYGCCHSSVLHEERAWKERKPRTRRVQRRREERSWRRDSQE